MSPFFIKAIQLLMSLSLLIVLHELGHFIPARIFKTRVEKFFLFFDVKFALFKKKIGDTTYGIGWLPLGGYVKISGMIDEKYGHRTNETTCARMGVSCKASMATSNYHAWWCNSKFNFRGSLFT